MINFFLIAKTPHLFELRQKWMIPSCCPWKVVTFFGKDHVNRSSINGVMIGRNWKIKFGKLKIGVTKKIMNLIVQLLPNITPLILDQFTCSLPKNVTTFHRQQDGINHFCLRPNKWGVLALWIHIFTKIFSKLDCSTSFKLPKHHFYWDWDKNGWFHLVACEK